MAAMSFHIALSNLDGSFILCVLPIAIAVRIQLHHKSLIVLIRVSSELTKDNR